MARIVLFGASGFVGSHIAKALESSEVIAPEWPAIDLAKPETLQGILREGDIVINAAGYANATDRTPEGLVLLRSANVDGVRNLAELCVEAGVAQLVHVSSVAAMGRVRGENVTEDTSVPVTSPYAASKLEGERMLGGARANLAVTILRPTSVFGEGRGLAGTLCRLASGRVIPLPAGGRALIPFTYIGNVAHAVTLTLGNERCFGKTFIVGDERSYSLREIVLRIAGSMGVKPRIVSVPKALALGGVMCLEAMGAIRRRPPVLDRGRLDTMTSSVSYSIEAFREATGYEQPYSFEESIERIVKWYLAGAERRAS